MKEAGCLLRLDLAKSVASSEVLRTIRKNDLVQARKDPSACLCFAAPQSGLRERIAFETSTTSHGAKARRKIAAAAR